MSVSERARFVFKLVYLCVFTPLLSNAFQLHCLQPSAQLSSNLHRGSHEPMPRIQPAQGFRPRPCYAQHPMPGTNALFPSAPLGMARTRQRTALLAESSSISSENILRVAGLQLHKFAGLVWLLVFEGAVGVVLKFHGIALPPSVIGLIFLTTLLFASERLLNLLTRLLSPAVGFLDRWMNCIFMPYIVAAALSTIPTGMQLVKALAFIVSSFVLMLTISGKLMEAFIALVPLPPPASASSSLDSGDVPASPPTPAPTPTPPPVVAAPPTVVWGTATLILAAAASVMHYAAVPVPLALSPCLVALHVFVFKLCQLVPRNLQAVGLAPTITGGAAMIALTAGFGAGMAGSWRVGVQCYMDLAGRLILSLVAPAVIALAFKVHQNRQEIARLWLPLLFTSAITVPASLLAAAALAAPLKLSPALALAMAPRHISSAMAAPMAITMGASPGMVVAVNSVTVMCGWSFGLQTLNLVRVRDPTARGAAVGCTYFSAGAAQLVNAEPDAAGAASVVFALNGVLATFLVAFAPFRHLLCSLAGMPLV